VRSDLITRVDALYTQIDKAVSDELRYPLQHKISQLQAELLTLDGQRRDVEPGRSGCGYDLTPQIASIPDDGEEYSYRCPACGNTGTVRKTAPEVAE
jgi:hypothetical protein